ncbi:NADH-dependent fumarate reductase subunit D [Hydrogenivirga caldilitoris]|uniref:NADH-dependent fumarate reductase subunit D n=1 Tax=Hydrogenivirga caldilitoris TaxID=246264 RepID=A0A497XPM3_9AQUI|nr:FAD/NAD(P)-binding oxidoreductase [Hydrogenivirga caldilitoris]RLJ70069.1 NADH-dependent fumarate reductase subunit D [Hydrogenivirga caldilitoris]
MRVVVVGNGPAAASAIEAFRKVDKDSELIVLSDEEYPTYAPNCMENVIRDDILPEALFYKGGEKFYERYRVDFRPKKEVVRLDNRRKVVVTKDGDEIRYDRCLLAAGAYAFVPPIQGIELEGITTAKTLKDAYQIREWVVSGRVKRAVIVGAGPIGIEDAETLRHMGVDVSVVEIFDRVLPRMLDREMGKIYGDTLQKETGIKVYLEHQVVAFHGSGWVEAVEIKPRGSDSSLFIETDMVIVSTGVRPRTYLVEGTDIAIHIDKKLNRPIGGILTNEYQQSSDPDVFAAGDIASGVDVWGNHRWIALFPPAQQAGYVAGFNLAGKRVKNPGLVDYNAVKTRSVTAGSGGLFEDAEEEFFVESGNYLVKVFLLEGKVRGYQFVGIPRKPTLNPHNKLLKAFNGKIKTWEEKVLSDKGFGLEASGVIFHCFLKLHRELRGFTKTAVENMLIRALANPALDLPLYI